MIFNGIHGHIAKAGFWFHANYSGIDAFRTAVALLQLAASVTDQIRALVGAPVLWNTL